ncbi:MAG: rRNA maturation RNase YbeY [Bacteroidales bacterium]|nr:rRNA maturation RNase YbeY [Bacteroidales bacterium]
MTFPHSGAKKPHIWYFSEGVSYTPNNKNKLRKWIIDSIVAENHLPGMINIIFCSDKVLIEINKKYLNRDYLTDVITFDMSEIDNVISGDIFISVEQVRENAKKYTQRIANEINRTVIHGVLHLIGYNDYSKDEKQAMVIKENFYLKRWNKLI